MIPAAFAAALEAMDRRLDPDSSAPLAVALSGGGDSLALLRIVKVWATAMRRPVEALTVDHGLHPDSAAWTQGAGEAALGTPWRALAWTGPKPATGLPAAARRARHALLAQAARAAGARVLLLGHTADDVAESELIRADTPTHGHLAEWSPSPAWPEGRDVFILRPLLRLRRADLRAWLAAEGVRWLDDPANADPRFARSRGRASLEGAALAAGVAGRAGPDPRSSARAPSQSKDEPEDGGGGRAAPDALSAYGFLDLSLARLLAAERPLDRLGKALLCVSGRSRPASGAALERLLARLAAGEAVTATLCGVRVRADGARARLTRELGRSPPQAVALAPGVTAVFDGRFEVAPHACGWCAAPLAGHAAALPRDERQALHALPADARPSLPVLIGPEGKVRLPGPDGAGPADIRCLVGARLSAAWGLARCERALEQGSQRRHARSAASALILSWGLA